MGGKSIIFALIAAAISGIVGEGVERGLNAADEKFQKWKSGNSDEDGNDETTDEADE